MYRVGFLKHYIVLDLNFFPGFLNFLKFVIIHVITVIAPLIFYLTRRNLSQNQLLPRRRRTTRSRLLGVDSFGVGGRPIYVRFYGFCVRDYQTCVMVCGSDVG